MSTIGKRIKARRDELGMSQDELAERMGYKSRSTIAKIEKGVNDVVQSNIVKFADVLNTSVAYLMGWDNEDSLTEDIKKDNDAIVSIIARMRLDKDFLSVVNILNTLDAEKFASVKQMLQAFLK